MPRPERHRTGTRTPDPGGAWHHRRMDPTEIKVVLVDGLRSFVDGRRADASGAMHVGYLEELTNTG